MESTTVNRVAVNAAIEYLVSDSCPSLWGGEASLVAKFGQSIQISTRGYTAETLAPPQEGPGKTIMGYVSGQGAINHQDSDLKKKSVYAEYGAPSERIGNYKITRWESPRDTSQGVLNIQHFRGGLLWNSPEANKLPAQWRLYYRYVEGNPIPYLLTQPLFQRGVVSHKNWWSLFKMSLPFIVSSLLHGKSPRIDLNIWNCIGEKVLASLNPSVTRGSVHMQTTRP